MALHNETGKKGEQAAVDYFVKAGYIILYQNWRHKRLEVDIIATRNGMLHFIEVKTRTSLVFGFPEENVSIKKIRHLINASAAFLRLQPQWQRIQFDVLSVTISGGEVVFFLIEDVYE